MSDKPSFNDYAFPTKESNSWGNHYHQGMTLRDYFAAKAMQGVFDSPIASSEAEKEYIAMHAYKMADAMLKAREQK